MSEVTPNNNDNVNQRIELNKLTDTQEEEKEEKCKLIY